MAEINIQVMSRMAAAEYCARRHSEESVIISISTPDLYYGYLKIEKTDKNNVTDILNLTTEQDLMSSDEAKAIVDFVERNKDKYIIVHCDAGISRSSAVVAAILKHYTGNDDMIFDSRRYNPNRWVYRKVLEAFESEVD